MHKLLVLYDFTWYTITIVRIMLKNNIEFCFLCPKRTLKCDHHLLPKKYIYMHFNVLAGQNKDMSKSAAHKLKNAGMQDTDAVCRLQRNSVSPSTLCVFCITSIHLPPGKSAKQYLAVQRSCKHYKTLQAVCLRRIKSESPDYFVTIATGQGANNSKFELTLRVLFCSFQLTLKSSPPLPPF